MPKENEIIVNALIDFINLEFQLGKIQIDTIGQDNK